MNHILFISITSCSNVCLEIRFPGWFTFLFTLPHNGFEILIINESIVKCRTSKYCAKNNMCVALVPLLRRARQKHGFKTAASSKT